MTNKYNSKRTCVDGKWFDSITESRFYKQHKGIYDRCEKSYTVWTSKYTKREITYTPDFINDDETIWVEIKSEITRTPEYLLRKELIMDYCLDNGIDFKELLEHKGQWLPYEKIKELTGLQVGAAAEIVKELDKLWNKRKTLKDEEFEKIYKLLHSNKLQHIRKGVYFARKKAFVALKHKLAVKDPIAKLKALHKEKQNIL